LRAQVAQDELTRCSEVTGIAVGTPVDGIGETKFED